MVVSGRFKNLFQPLVDAKQIEFYSAVIIDESRKENRDFWVLNVLNIVPCLNKLESVYDLDEDGFYSIKKLRIDPRALRDRSIVRMAEHSSYVIVTSEFKEKCELAELKGIGFIEEGSSIYR